MKEVKIDSCFWSNIKKHETLIKKCFFYLLNKYPNPEGRNDAYNTLIVKMHHMKVFQRFDEDRAKKEDKDKAFQQFLYKYIEKILGDTYRSRVKQSKRFAPVEYVEEITPVTYSLLVNPNDTSFAKPEDFDDEGNIKKPVRNNYPSINDIGEYVGHKGFNAHDELEASDLVVKIREVLKGDIEKTVFDLREEHGFNVVDIAVTMKYTPQNVSLILNKIKNRCIDKGLLNKSNRRKHINIRETVEQE